MNEPETVSMYYSAIQAIGVVVSFPILLWQMYKDHWRRRAEATIHYMNEISDDYRDTEMVLSGGTLVDEQSAKAIFESAVHKSQAAKLFARLEHLSAGVITGTFDIELIDRMSGSYLVDIYRRWHTYLQLAINSSNNNRRYDQFETLAVELASRRNLNVQKLKR